MPDTYATVDDLTARLSSAYTTPDDAEKLLLKASELIDYVTMGRAQAAWDAVGDPPSTDARVLARAASLAAATCDQVEYWLEVGEEHDVLGLPRGSSLQGGRVQVNRMPGFLGQRVLRTLVAAGIYWAGAPAL